MIWHIDTAKFIYLYNGKRVTESRTINKQVGVGDSFTLDLTYPHIKNKDTCILQTLGFYNPEGELLMDRPVDVQIEPNEEWEWIFKFKQLNEVDPRVSSILRLKRD